MSPVRYYILEHVYEAGPDTPPDRCTNAGCAHLETRILRRCSFVELGSTDSKWRREGNMIYHTEANILSDEAIEEGLHCGLLRNMMPGTEQMTLKL